MRRLDRRSFLLQVVGASMAGSLAAQPNAARRMMVDSDASDPARPIPAPAPPSPPIPVPDSGAAAPASATGATGAAAPAGRFIVVRVRGPSASLYPLGTRLEHDARITLRAGDALVVLGAAGTQTLVGPGTFSPGAAVQAGLSAATGGRGRSARIGAVRGRTERFVVCPGHPRCPR